MMPTARRPQLTPEEQSVLDFIKRHFTTYGFAPSIAEIADDHECSISKAHSIRGRLIAAGAITVKPGAARAIKINEEYL